MGAYFFDSSALVKCYVAEIGSDWTRAVVEDTEHSVHVASLTRVEVVSALARRFRRGDISEPELEAALATAQSHIPNRFELVEITEETIVAAVRLAKKHGLR